MKPKSILVYILFFIAAFIAFLFLLFPQKQVAAYLSRSLTIPNSNIRFSIDNVKLALPFNLIFEGSNLMYPPIVVYRAEAELSEIIQKKLEAEKNQELSRNYFNFLLNKQYYYHF